MAEGTGSDIEDGDFEDLMLESDVRGYLYEPQYSDEQLKLLEEQDAASTAAIAEAVPACCGRGARNGSNWGGLVVPVLSLCAYGYRGRVCCREFQRCRFLLDEI